MPKTQFMIRLPDPALERLVEIAVEQGFTGGRGRHGNDEPNKAEAVRWLLGQADEKMHGALYDEAPPAPPVEPPAKAHSLLLPCPECGGELGVDVHDDGHTSIFCGACGWRD